jgi:hypothetical protein
LKTIVKTVIGKKDVIDIPDIITITTEGIIENSIIQSICLESTGAALYDISIYPCVERIFQEYSFHISGNGVEDNIIVI